MDNPVTQTALGSKKVRLKAKTNKAHITENYKDDQHRPH